jgi:AmmeMemoRadiSam system protein B
MAVSAVALSCGGCTGRTEAVPAIRSHYLDYQYSSFSDNREYYQRSFDRAAEKYDPIAVGQDRLLRSVRWGVVTHHLLARDLTAAYFLRLSALVRPRTIVLFGPNHFSRGRTPVAVSLLPWQTPFGVIQPDLDLAGAMMREGLVEENEDAFYNEHSIGAVVPFVKHAFPDARIVPIVVRADADISAARKLARFVAEHASDEVVFLASLDFSHDQSSDVAMAQDSLTYSVLRRFDVSGYRTAFVDSRLVFLTVMESCKQLGATEIVMVHHTNSAILESQPLTKCTSYMNMMIGQTREAWN